MLIDKKDIIIAVLCLMLFGCMFIIACQYEQSNTLKDEIYTNRGFISTELHFIDNIIIMHNIKVFNCCFPYSCFGVRYALSRYPPGRFLF